MSGPELSVERGAAVRNLASNSGRKFYVSKDGFRRLQSSRSFLLGFYMECLRSFIGVPVLSLRFKGLGTAKVGY